MKINFALWSTRRTGGTRVIFEVANRLAKRGHEVTITSLGTPRHQWFRFSDKVRIIYPESKYSIYIPFKGRFSISLLSNWLLGKIKIPYYIDRNKILALAIPDDVDINVATYCLSAHAVYGSGKGRPFYYIQHYEPLFFASDPYLYHIAKETYYLPMKWIVNSSWVNGMLRKEIGREGPVVLPGVDTSVFFPRNVEKRRDVKAIIALGKRGKAGNLNYIYKALNIIRKSSNLKLKLILYGDDPRLAKLSPVPTEYFVNPSDEKLAELYSMADVAVNPSPYESSPLPPLEAMACGTPVVTTRYGTEDYCFHEVNSLVVPPEDPESMAKAIFRILTDENLAEELRKNGLRTAKELTWDKTAENVEKIFRQGLNEDPQ
ncbi:MAG TPA: glycosyltransferase family 4 protein [Sulfolobales archaeon]|jgi:glycosyltransferase involved in cell wall biosynthesis|nr:glycosyltransferase family 4 protein [Sulfolobales archaeon]